MTTPCKYSCLGNPVDRGAWWAAVLGPQSQTRLSTRVDMSVPVSPLIPPLRPLGVHTSVLYVCASISASQIRSSVPSLWIPHARANVSLFLSVFALSVHPSFSPSSSLHMAGICECCI